MTDAPLTGDYLGMPLAVDSGDAENRAFFQACAAGEFCLQRCSGCGLMRYPPSTGCPHCGAPESSWEPVEPRGTVYTYAEVVHAIQPAFREHAPYMVVFVELDSQSGAPEVGDGLRVAGNLVTLDGTLAPPELVARVGIGARMRMVFKPVGEGFALPMWTLDEDAAQPAAQPAAPWRYPE
jgi:uncharacterized OB-fold protein